MADDKDSERFEPTLPSRDAIARRAHELWESRGGQPGHELENWLDAERELSGASPRHARNGGARSRRKG